MKRIEWKNDYETGIDRIDFQHRNLVNILNDIISIPDLPPYQRRTVLELNLSEIAQYVKFHFEYEEQLMTEANYPKFTEHKAAHEALKKKMTQLLSRFNANEEGLENEMIIFLKDWLLNHIGKADMDYAPYLKAHEKAS